MLFSQRQVEETAADQGESEKSCPEEERPWPGLSGSQIMLSSAVCLEVVSLQLTLT